MGSECTHSVTADSVEFMLLIVNMHANLQFLTWAHMQCVACAVTFFLSKFWSLQHFTSGCHCQKLKSAGSCSYFERTFQIIVLWAVVSTDVVCVVVMSSMVDTYSDDFGLLDFRRSQHGAGMSSRSQVHLAVCSVQESTSPIKDATRNVGQCPTWCPTCWI